MAIIRVGAATEVELKEKKHRVEDALSATRAAVEEGIVPGGGVALINAVERAGRGRGWRRRRHLTGVTLLRRALEEPMREIAANAGMDGACDRSRPCAGCRRSRATLRLGYDVISEEYVDMVKAGIIDPAKVTRGGLENAASIAAMILTTEALITDIPEKEKMPPMPGGGGMDF